MPKTQNISLPASVRTKLRKILRNHPNILNYHRIKSDVNDLPRDELIKLADNLELDWIGEINDSFPPPDSKKFSRNDFFFLMDFERGGFKGVYEFDLDLSLLGMVVTKKVKCEYEWTPAWQYFCVIDKRLKYRWEGSVYSLMIEEIEYENINADDSIEEKGRYWTEFTPDVLEGSLSARLDRKIELDIWEKDQINRKQNGFPPGDKSKCWLFSE